MIERLCTCALTMALLLGAAPALAQGDAEAEAMAAWQEYMTPSEAHQEMAQGVGDWRQELTFWMAPDAPPQQATSTSTLESILGGRYLVERMTGSMMGMEFEGRGTFGYDNAKDEYFMTWIDNMGTGLMTGWGTKEGNKVTFEGTFVDPDSGDEKPFRTVVTEVDPNHSIMEMYVPTPDGSGEFKSMEIHSYRVGA